MTYQPIACALHEKLEYSVLKCLRLQLRYLDASNQEMIVIALPLDVYTENAAEWLRMQHVDGRVEILRLDAILFIAESV